MSSPRPIFRPFQSGREVHIENLLQIFKTSPGLSIYLYTAEGAADFWISRVFYLPVYMQPERAADF